MDWLPAWVRYDTALIVVGVVLLLNPLYVGALHLDEPNWYRYEAAPVSFTDDGIDAPIDALFRGLDDDVACLNGNHRACQLERHVNRTGGIPYPEQRLASPGTGYRYVYLDSQFYRVQPFGSGGNGNLSLESIDRTEALSYISTPLDETSAAIRTAIETGAVETHTQLPGAYQLIRVDANYFVVYRTASRTYGSAYDRKRLEGRLMEGGLMGVLVGVGLWAVLRGQTHRLRRRWR